MTFKKWNELPVNVRRSPRKLYEYIVSEIANSENNDEEEEFTPETYYFTSYADAQGETEWGSGTVETTGVTSGNYTQVEVKTNSPEDSFVGNKYYIISTAKTDGTIYRLYNGAGSNPADIYVSISTTAP